MLSCSSCSQVCAGPYFFSYSSYWSDLAFTYLAAAVDGWGNMRPHELTSHIEVPVFAISHGEKDANYPYVVDVVVSRLHFFFVRSALTHSLAANDRFRLLAVSFAPLHTKAAVRAPLPNARTTVFHFFARSRARR